MKAILLAAGQGSRLRPLTNEIPKCMVPYLGKPLINHTLETLRHCGVEEIVVVAGYKAEVLEAHLKDEGVMVVRNPQFASTNMVYSLFCAEGEMNDDLIISYTDITYTPDVLNALLDDDAPISVVVDRAWQELWAMRKETDVESMDIENGYIQSLGQKVEDPSSVEGQYIGLLKFSKESLPQIRTLPREDQMYMTDFVQQMTPVKAVEIHGGWLEVDTVADLEAYTRAGSSFLLKERSGYLA